MIRCECAKLKVFMRILAALSTRAAGFVVFGVLLAGVKASFCLEVVSATNSAPTQLNFARWSRTPLVCEGTISAVQFEAMCAMLCAFIIRSYHCTS